MGPDTNKKKVAALIMAKLRPSGQTEDVAGAEDADTSDVSEAEKSCASDYLSAIEAKDPVALVRAFKDLLDVLQPSEAPDSEAPKSIYD